MACYLWAVVSRETLAFVRMQVTTDQSPTHSDGEIWVRVGEFWTGAFTVV